MAATLVADVKDMYYRITGDYLSDEKAAMITRIAAEANFPLVRFVQFVATQSISVLKGGKNGTCPNFAGINDADRWFDSVLYPRNTGTM